jgi:hypothetical protein
MHKAIDPKDINTMALISLLLLPTGITLDSRLVEELARRIDGSLSEEARRAVQRQHP